jgi:hypothetical protein
VVVVVSVLSELAVSVLVELLVPVELLLLVPVEAVKCFSAGASVSAQ